MALQLTDDFRAAKVAVRTSLYLLVLIAIIASVWVFRQSNASAMVGELDGTSFITTWKTDSPGSSNSTSISLNLQSSSYDVDWDNDGEFDEFGLTGSISHDYGTPGVYTVRIQSEAMRIIMSNHNGDSQKLSEINQWGTTKWWSMEDAFRGASNMVITATDAPDLSGVTKVEMMFGYASSLTGGVAHWDVSNIQDFDYMFSNASSFNEDLTSWDVSSATSMEVMFGQASSFNGDISNWDVRNVTSMLGMFQVATSFNNDITGWDVSNVTNFDSMFINASLFNQDLSLWNVSNAQYLSNMLRGANLSSENYDAILTVWATLPVQTGVAFSVYPTCYSTALSARTYLKEEAGWVISDGGDCGDTSERGIASVSFFEEGDRKYMVVEGSKMFSQIDIEALFVPYFGLNGNILPICVDKLGLSLEEIAAIFETTMAPLSATLTASLEAPCVRYTPIDQGVMSFEFSPDTFVVWLPDDFDTIQPGVVSVSELDRDLLLNEQKIEMLNPIAYTFNSDGGSETPQPPAITVGGNSIEEVTTIAKRPTFSGTAEPGATVTVTVYSDPVTCTTTADQDGNWTCTLPADLPAGSHSVYVRVVNTDSSVQEFGPYAVTVDGVNAGVVDSNTPTAPNTGILTQTAKKTFETVANSKAVAVSSFAAAGALSALAVGALALGGKRLVRRFVNAV